MINIIRISSPYFPKVFTPLGNGLYTVNLYGVESLEINGVTCTYEEMLQIKPSRIDSIRIGLLYYSAVSSIAECWNNPKTFYYDSSNYRVIINICDSTGLIGYQTPTGLQKLELLIVDGYTDRVDYTRENGCYYEDIYHAPRVSSIGDISEKRDKTFYDNISYTSTSVDMENHDGFFDGSKLANTVVYYYQLEDGKEFDSAILRLKGIVSKPTITNTKLSFTIDDIRKGLDVKIDIGRINKTNFPYYSGDNPKDEAEEKIFPIAIGEIKKYQPTCVNKADINNQYADYALCIAYGNYKLKSVDRVWIQLTDENNQNYDLIIPAIGQTITSPKPISTDSVYASVCGVPYTIDYDKGILRINRGTVCSASVNDTDISYSWTDLNVDFFGWYDSTGTNPNLCSVDLIRIGLETFGGIDFETWNYDLSNFAQERLKSIEMRNAGWTVSKIIDSDTTITDYLKEICQSLHIVYKNRGDGRYTCKVYKDEAAGDIKYEILPRQLIDRTDSSTTDTSEILSTVKIKYGYSGNSENEASLTDDSKETEIQQTLHVSKTSDFDTILTTKEAAQLKATALLDASLSPGTQTKFTLWRDSINSTLCVSDSIIAPADRNNTRAIFNITAVNLSPIKNTISITANKIADIEFSNYIQGNCYRLTIFGANVLAKTTYTEDY